MAEEKKEEKKAETPEKAVEAEKPAEPVEDAAKKTGETGAAGGTGKEDKPAEPDWKALYALTLADFDNYTKRAARDREDSYRFAEADILGDVLPAVDNLQLALANASEKKDDPFVKGVQLVFDSLLKALKEHGAEPFDSVGQELDTSKMEAIAQLPSDSVDEGKVSNEVKRGWMLKGKVLRAAQVVVSAGKPG